MAGKEEKHKRFETEKIDQMDSTSAVVPCSDCGSMVPEENLLLHQVRSCKGRSRESATTVNHHRGTDHENVASPARKTRIIDTSSGFARRLERGGRAYHRRERDHLLSPGVSVDLTSPTHLPQPLPTQVQASNVRREVATSSSRLQQHYSRHAGDEDDDDSSYVASESAEEDDSEGSKAKQVVDLVDRNDRVTTAPSNSVSSMQQSTLEDLTVDDSSDDGVVNADAEQSTSRESLRRDEALGSVVNVSSDPAEWACPQCTLINDYRRQLCEACGFSNPNFVRPGSTSRSRLIEIGRAHV